MLIATVFTLVMVAGAAAPAPTHVPPVIPTPLFIEDKRFPPKTSYQFEVSFRPSTGHYLDDIHRFYEEWARAKKWRKVSGEEESWSADRWISFQDQKGREVWQRLATWVDPTGYWSLRLAMRDYRSDPDNRAVVLLEPFVNLDKVPKP